MKTEGYLLRGETTKKEEYREYHRSYIDDIPVSFLKSFSKITLRPNEEVSHYFHSRTLVIPVSGGIDLDQNNVLVSGEYWELNDKQRVLKNASPDYETTFFVVELELPQEGNSKVNQIYINPEASEKPLEPSFGRYTYREEKNLKYKNASDCFIHVISGNFEIEERFVNQGDSLILENINSIEFECLSEQGLFLLLKV